MGVENLRGLLAAKDFLLRLNGKQRSGSEKKQEQILTADFRMLVDLSAPHNVGCESTADGAAGNPERTSTNPAGRERVWQMQRGSIYVGSLAGS